MRHTIAVVASVAVLCVACGESQGGLTRGSSVPSPDGGEETPSETDAVGPVAYELLGVQQSAGEMGAVEHAADEGRYVQLWERFSFDESPPTVDFDEYVVLFYARAEDGCPDEIGDVRLDGDRLIVDWRPPAGGCIQPLIPTAFALAVHRATVPRTFVAVLEGFHGDYEEIEHRVELAAYEGPAPAGAPTRPAPPEPTTVAGTVELPPQGEAAPRMLDDGTRVWVVHHRDGAVSVLAGEAPADVRTELFSVRGLSTQVLWYPSARRFGGAGVGGGWYDEYGVSLRGRSVTNLDWFESAVDGSRVSVGQRVGPVPFEKPVTEDATDGAAGQPDWHDHPRQVTALSLEEARRRPEGSVVVIDTALVAYSSEPLRLCDAPEAPELWDWDGCPNDAPKPLDLVLEQTDPDSMWVWHGPLRARVTNNGFSGITLLGAGHSGGRIDD